MFDDLTAPAPDSLMLVAKRVREDRRPGKLDLGVGIYRDAVGRSPVMPVIASAAALLLRSEGSATYLSPAGDPEFVELLARHVLTPALRDRLGGIVAGVQAPGGTGALRLAAELVRAVRPDATVRVGLPTWPNHLPILRAVGLNVATFDLIDLAAQRLRFDALLDSLAQAAPGDVVLLQGCCHNPTGVDCSDAQWAVLAEVLERRGLIPLIDFAYQGLGVGIEEDSWAVRLLSERLPEVLVAVACSKSFGLYRERVGMLLVKARGGGAAAAASGVLQTIVRASYSNPPAHGAALVRTVLGSPELASGWRADLDGKRERIRAVRREVAAAASAAGLDLGYVATQRGLFTTLPIGPDAVARLGKDFAIHLPSTGRVNVAGLSTATIPRFIDALKQVGVASARPERCAQ